jgi:N4-gp56 family major capsid protein
MLNKEKMLINLQLFNANTNVTTATELSPEMKTYYSDYLIDNAEPKLVHDQFAQKHPIPANGGKNIEFRKYSPLAKAMTPITEGVTPTGKKLTVTTLEATVQQYGDYIELSDMLLLTAIDNNMVQATKLLGSQAGETLDTVTREVLNGGTNVQYANGTKAARYALVGGDATAANNDYMAVYGIKLSARFLKNQKAQKIQDSYVAIAHPDTLFDIMNDDEWIEASKYAGSTQIFEGEVGKIAGVRFMETTEAKIFHATDLTTGARNLSVKTAITVAAATVAVKEVITAADATALVGRKVLIGTTQYEIESASAAAAGSATITLKTTLTVAVDTVIYPGEAGKAGRDVYSTLVMGENAYGTTEITGGGLQHIVKQLGSSGTADPLNQRATVGWKATKVAERLVESFLLRIETASTFQSGAN